MFSINNVAFASNDMDTVIQRHHQIIDQVLEDREDAVMPELYRGMERIFELIAPRGSPIASNPRPERFGWESLTVFVGFITISIVGWFVITHSRDAWDWCRGLVGEVTQQAVSSTLIITRQMVRDRAYELLADPRTHDQTLELFQQLLRQPPQA
jgi:hypothetical protein